MTRFAADWSVRQLSEVTLPVQKVNPVEAGRSSIRYLDIGSIKGPTLNPPAIQEIAAVDAPSRARQVVRPGDVVFSTVRPYLEKIALVGAALDGEFASTGFCVLRPSPDILPKFLYYFAISRSMLDQVLPFQKGVSYPAVLDREVKASRMPVPPVEEQRRIVEILEDHLSRLDAADAGVRSAEVRIRLLVKASSASIVGRVESDKSVPNVRLSDIAMIGSGGTPRRGDTRYWDAGTIPWVTSGDLSQGVIATASQFITEVALSETSVRRWPAGTLLVAMYGEGKTRGTVGELAIDATTNQACAAVSLMDPSDVSRSWLRLVLESRYDALRRESSGGVQPNLTLGYFKTLVVPWPEADHAAKLVEQHRSHVEKARRLECDLRTNRKRSATLRRALLAAAFSGRLTGAKSDFERIEEMAGV